MSANAMFDGAPERGTINFSVGQPSADLLPLALLGAAGERFFAGAVPLELNYGQRQGDARFRAALAAFLGAAEGVAVDPDSLMLTGGISQGLDFACGRLEAHRRKSDGGRIAQEPRARGAKSHLHTATECRALPRPR